MSGPVPALGALPLLLLLLLLLASPGGATEVEVQVLNTADAAGVMRVELCQEAEWLQGCAISAQAPARPGLSTVTVPDVPPGVYGVIAHHDSDGDGEVNRNFLGLPTEGIGFSRDAQIRFGPPRFGDAALRIGGDRAVVPVTLHFERPSGR